MQSYETNKTYFLQQLICIKVGIKVLLFQECVKNFYFGLCNFFITSVHFKIVGVGVMNPNLKLITKEQTIKDRYSLKIT